MKKFLLSAIVLGAIQVSTIAQGVTIGDTNTAPHPSAALQIKSNKGFLPPKLNTVQRNAIVGPAVGLTIYNTTTNCMQTYFPGGWKDIGCDCNVFPNPGFTVSSSPAINIPVNFNCPDPGPTYAWIFPSGSPATSTLQNPSVTWTQPGTYPVILTVTNALGCASSDTQTVTVSSCNYVPGSQTFNFTGSMQTFTVPSCITSISIAATGAKGSNGNGSGPISGGLGGQASGTLTVTPGQQLFVFVGGTTGYNGGATGGTGGGQGGQSGNAGTGGGASDVRSGGQNLTNRVIVAGGGGGGGNSYFNGSFCCGVAGPGGNGGGNTGITGSNGGNQSGLPGSGGVGGSQVSGGAGGAPGGGGNSGTGGSLGSGGAGASGGYYVAGGGGGGGYYGGGGGGGADVGSGGGGGGGGGGSSYIGGVTNGSTTPSGGNGNGTIVITW